MPVSSIHLPWVITKRNTKEGEKKSKNNQERKMAKSHNVQPGKATNITWLGS